MLTASQPGCMSTQSKRARAAPNMGTPAGRASYRDVLGAGEFRVIFLANVVSMLGSVVAAVALTVLVYQQTRSPALAASVLALSFLPYLLGGALLGAAADRLSARRVLVGCDLASAVLVACMVVPGMPVPGLLALLFANGLIAPVYQGVRSAVLPKILPPGPRYVLGRSLMRMVAQSAQIVGYGVGGLLLAILSPRGALAADALSFAASGVRGRARGPRRPLCRPHRPAAPRRWPAADRNPGRDRSGGCPCRAPAPVTVAAQHYPPGWAAGLRAPGGVRGQSRPRPGPGAAADLRARLRLGSRDRWPAHRGSTTGPAEPCPRPGQRGPHVHPGPGVRTVGNRRTVPPLGRCHPHGRRRRCPRRRHASAGLAAPPARQRAPRKESCS